MKFWKAFRIRKSFLLFLFSTDFVPFAEVPSRPRHSHSVRTLPLAFSACAPSKDVLAPRARSPVTSHQRGNDSMVRHTFMVCSMACILSWACIFLYVYTEFHQLRKISSSHCNTCVIQYFWGNNS